MRKNSFKIILNHKNGSNVGSKHYIPLNVFPLIHKKNMKRFSITGYKIRFKIPEINCVKKYLSHSGHWKYQWAKPSNTTRTN